MNHYLQSAGKMHQQLLNVYQYKLHIWNEYILFNWHWWFGVVLTIIPVLIWLKYHQKSNTAGLLFAGLSSAILASFLDTSGHFFGWYDYQYDVLPMASNYIPWDFVAIPVLIMFTIQLFNKINVYLKGIILSAFVSFVGLPLLKVIRIFTLINWHYFYSFILMFIIFILAYQMSKFGNRNKV